MAKQTPTVSGLILLHCAQKLKMPAERNRAESQLMIIFIINECFNYIALTVGLRSKR